MFNKFKVKRLFKKADSFFKDEQYDDALKYYNEILELDNSNLKALYKKAFISYKRKLFDESIQILNSILDLKCCIDAILLLGRIYLLKNDTGKGMYYYNLSLNEDIFNLSKFMEEIFYFDDIDFKYICKDYKRLYCIAIGLNNLYIEKYDDDWRRLWKAYQLYKLGYNEKALSVLDNLPESFLDNYYFNFLKSLILLNLSKYEDALFYANKGFKYDLDNENYYLQNQNKDECLYYLGDYDEAINCFNKAIQLVEEISDPFIFLSKISIKNKKYEDALKKINTAIKFEIASLNRIKGNPSTLFFEKTDCEVFYYKSFILFKLKRYDEALKICNCILDKVPDCSEAIKLKKQIETNY